MNTKAKNPFYLIVYYFFIVFIFLHIISCFHLFLKHFLYSDLICYFISFALAAFAAFLSYNIWKCKNALSVFHNIRVLFISKLTKCSNSVCCVLLLVFIIPFLLRILLIFLFHIPIQGDPGVYIDISKEIVANGIISRNADYSSNFPHLFWFGMFLVPASLFSSFGDWVFQVYISFVISCNALLVYYIGKCICNSKLDAIRIAIIYSYLPSQLFCGLTVTHEIFFNLFLLSSIAVWCKSKSLLSWGIVCLLLSIAKLVNSTGIVAFLALLFCVLFFGFGNTKIKNIISALLLFVFIVAIVSSCANAIQITMTKGDVVLRKSSIEWQLYVGGNLDTNGEWNIQDVETFSKISDNMSNLNDAKSAYRELVVSRWSLILKSPLNLVKHFIQKFCLDWSGTHYSIGRTSYYVTGRISSAFMFVIMLFNNLLYTIMISFSFSRMFRKRKAIEPDVVIFMKVLILGTVCMFLFTETMNKYTLTMLGPIILLLGYYLFSTNPANEYVVR